MINLNKQAFHMAMLVLLIILLTLGVQAQDGEAGSGDIAGDVIRLPDTEIVGKIRPLTFEELQAVLEQNFEGEFELESIGEFGDELQKRFVSVRDSNGGEASVYQRIYQRIIAHLIETHGLARFGRNIPNMFVAKPTGRTVYWAYAVGYSTSCGGETDWTISQVPPKRTQKTDFGTVYIDAPISLYIEGDKVTYITPHSTYHGNTKQTLYVENGTSLPMIIFNAQVSVATDVTEGVHHRWTVESSKTSIEPYLFSASLNTYLPGGDCANSVHFIFLHPYMPNLDIACWLPLVGGPTPRNVYLPNELPQSEESPAPSESSTAETEEGATEPETEVPETNKNPYVCRLPETEPTLDAIRAETSDADGDTESPTTGGNADDQDRSEDTDLPDDGNEDDTDESPDEQDKSEDTDSPDDGDNDNGSVTDRQITIDDLQVLTPPLSGKKMFIHLSVRGTFDPNTFNYLDAYADLNGDGIVAEGRENIFRNYPATDGFGFIFGVELPDVPAGTEIKLRFRFKTSEDYTRANLEIANEIEYLIKVQ